MTAVFAISIRFLAGRYHATPWGRHVNEADVAWPPEPWRILRALVATWHRKADCDRFDPSLMADLIDRLAAELPVYRLPPTVHAHTRHFMPWFKKGPRDRTLVFDAFARVDPEEPLHIVWPDVVLSGDMAALAAHMVERLGYLGRAESWIEATIVPAGQESFSACDCRPGEQTSDPQTGEVFDLVPLLAALDSASYAEERRRWLDALSTRPAKKQKPLPVTLGERLIDALSCDTAEWQRVGWSQPPAARRVFYQRPAGALAPTSIRVPRRTSARSESLTTARFVLDGKPLPRIEDAVRVAEWMKSALMSKAKSVLGENKIPAVLSGHGARRDPTHAHAFVLPEDADGDRRIDHIVVHAAAGFPPECWPALGGLRALHGRDGIVWSVALESLTSAAATAESSKLTRTERTWHSVTPYLRPWHIKKDFGSVEQIREECRRRGLPVPTEIAPREKAPVRAAHFHRFRLKRGLMQPDTGGGFWRITFAEPLQGPLALGFGCHYGLGLFAASED